jgi:hypothetical protein
MKTNRWIPMVVVVAVLVAACGQTDTGGSNGGNGGNGGNSECGSDCLTEVRPRVRMLRPGGASAVGVTDTTQIASEGEVFVDQSGTADVTFGHAAACELIQVMSSKEADLLTRSPNNAFFSLLAGTTHCIFSDRLQGVAPSDLCGIGEVLATGVTIGRASCQREPVFEVAVFRGAFIVTDPSGVETALGEGLRLRFDFESQEAVIEPATFTPEEIEVFERLAASIDLEIPPPTPSPSSPPPAAPENLEPPTISRGDPQGPLVANPGAWTGDPSFTYRWEGNCSSDGTGCVAIVGAEEQTYTPGDDCPYVRVMVTASTEGGSVSVASAPFDLNCVE